MRILKGVLNWSWTSLNASHCQRGLKMAGNENVKNVRGGGGAKNEEFQMFGELTS